MTTIRRPRRERAGLRECQHISARQLTTLDDIRDRREWCFVPGRTQPIDQLVADSAHEPPTNPHRRPHRIIRLFRRALPVTCLETWRPYLDAVALGVVHQR